eukprot:scaffold13430_cov43-Phaeocystis_antarctica.AAC.1
MARSQSHTATHDVRSFVRSLCLFYQKSIIYLRLYQSRSQTSMRSHTVAQSHSRTVTRAHELSDSRPHLDDWRAPHHDARRTRQEELDTRLDNEEEDDERANGAADANAPQYEPNGGWVRRGR